MTASSRSSRAIVWLIVSFVAFVGCTKTIVTEVESRECKELRASLGQKPPAAAAAGSHTCEAMCTKYAECNPAVSGHRQACILQCDQQREAVATNPICYTFRESFVTCKIGLSCFDLVALDASIPTWMNGIRLEGIRCIDEFEADFLYCSGAPIAANCLSNCGRVMACAEDGRTPNECAFGCLHNHQNRLQEHGPACGAAFLEYMQCWTSLSCAERRLPVRSDSENCGAQFAKQEKACSAPKNL